jgi:hypothetical protein
MQSVSFLNRITLFFSACCVAVCKPSDLIREESLRFVVEATYTPQEDFPVMKLLHHWKIFVHVRLLLVVWTCDNPTELDPAYVRAVGEVRLQLRQCLTVATARCRAAKERTFIASLCACCELPASGEVCAFLGYYAALSGSSVPTFRDNLSVPSSRVKMFKKKGVLHPWRRKDFLALENGTDRLSRNVGTELPLNAAYVPEERRCYLHHGGSVKSPRLQMFERLLITAHSLQRCSSKAVPPCVKKIRKQTQH